jgi:hypothetical protein
MVLFVFVVQCTGILRFDKHLSIFGGGIIVIVANCGQGLHFVTY